MKIKSLYLSLESNDFLIPNPPNSKFPFRVSSIVSDFNFQSDFFTHYIEKELIKLKFENKKINMIMIRCRKNNEIKNFIEEHHKCLTIEVPFNEKLYKSLYPVQNDYPLKGLLKPIVRENEFNLFLFERIMEGLLVAKRDNLPIPYERLIDITLDFKNKKFNNEWVYKKKIFKKNSLKVYLKSKKTCNYFQLKIIIEKNNKNILEKNILETLPRVEFYEDEIGEIIMQKDELIITKKIPKNDCLFRIDILNIE